MFAELRGNFEADSRGSSCNQSHLPLQDSCFERRFHKIQRFQTETFFFLCFEIVVFFFPPSLKQNTCIYTLIKSDSLITVHIFITLK